MKTKQPYLLMFALIAILVVAVGYSYSLTTVITPEQDIYGWLTRYVTPDNQAVINNMNHIIEPDGVITIEDLYKLHEWVYSNIDYTDSNPTYPEETLRTGKGNCWSQTSLVYSLILAEDPNADSVIILINLTYDGVNYTHCSVMTYFGNNVVISDTTVNPAFCKLGPKNYVTNYIVQSTRIDTYKIIGEVKYETNN